MASSCEALPLWVISPRNRGYPLYLRKRMFALRDRFSRLSAHAFVIVRLIGTASLSHLPCTADDCANAGTAPGISTYRTDDRATRCAARCSCCRGRRTSCVTSISCATLRLRLGYRVIRQDYNRDGENQKTAVLFHCAFSSTVWFLPGNSREPPLEVTSRSFVIG